MQSTQDLFTWKTQIGKKNHGTSQVQANTALEIEQLQELLTDPVDPQPMS